MNDKNVMTDDFAKIGEDVAVCAQQFLHAVVIKENLPGFSTLIEDIK